MRLEIFKSICTLIMCDDPTKLPEDQREELEKWANDEARMFGFDNWVEAYHYNFDDTGSRKIAGSTEEKLNQFEQAMKDLKADEGDVRSAKDNLQRRRTQIDFILDKFDLPVGMSVLGEYVVTRKCAPPGAPNYDEYTIEPAHIVSTDE